MDKQEKNVLKYNKVEITILMSKSETKAIIRKATINSRKCGMEEKREYIYILKKMWV